MTLSKKALAVSIAAALAISQSAAASAAVPRAGAPIDESEALGVSADAAPFLAAFAVFLVTGLVLLLTDDDDDDFPVSP